MKKQVSRGLRNNNPGNIRKSESSKYLGEVLPSQDPAFKQFESMSWGYRAMFVLLYTYQKRYKDRTIRQMISRYAPPCENDTEAYIRAVASRSFVPADSNISADNKEVMVPIVAAMSQVENGTPADMADVRAGWDLFLKHRP